MHDTTPAANRGGHKTQPATEAREISLLEWDAARHAAGHPKPDLHKPAWPGEALRETAAHQASLRALLAQESRAAQHQAAARRATKPARVPRDPEPAKLGSVVACIVGVILLLIGLSTAGQWAADVITSAASYSTGATK